MQMPLSNQCKIDYPTTNMQCKRLNIRLPLHKRIFNANMTGYYAPRSMPLNAFPKNSILNAFAKMDDGRR